MWCGVVWWPGGVWSDVVWCGVEVWGDASVSVSKPLKNPIRVCTEDDGGGV